MTDDTTSRRLPPGQTLLFDADDTLWENNIYFERAISAFISYLDHREHSPEEVREHLNACERKTIAAQGYGLKSFRNSLVACFEQLTDQPVTADKHDHIVSFGQSCRGPGDRVAARRRETSLCWPSVTGAFLSPKATPWNSATNRPLRTPSRTSTQSEVLAEKNDAAYHLIALQHECDRPRTWMVGSN